jgi:signal transduction histidine kinase
VASEATRGEWVAVACYLLFLAYAGYYGSTSSGRPGPVVLTEELIRLVGWLAVTPAAFAALDLAPLVRGQLLRSLSLVVAVAAIAGLVQGIAVVGLAHLAALAVPGISDELVGPGALTGAVWRAATTFPVYGFLPYFVLLRIHLGRQRREAAWERELSLARARLKALSVELQPHFLFNTLNSIAGLVRNDPRTAESMLVTLSDLLRATLDGAGAEASSLGDEIERLELYVVLQRMRFGPRLTVTTSVPDAIRSARIPGMLLQPLVENALTHGIGPKDGPGTITISGLRRGDRLVLTVEDDGVGLADDAAERERIGVGNTRARLATLFPDDYRFDLMPGPSGGARATIDIPFRPVSGARADR